MSAVEKFALVSHYLPPSRYGQPRVIHRLLEPLSPASYCLVSVEAYDRGNQRPDDDAPWLPGQYFKIDPGMAWRRAGRFPLLRILGTLVSAVFAIRTRAREIAAILRAQGCKIAVACSGDIADLPATWLACRRTGVRFIPYMFDDYVEQWAFMPALRRFAAIVERRFISDADTVIVPNEFLAREYAARYEGQANVTIVHNPWLSEPLQALEGASDGKSGTRRIVYTGSIYHVHFDAFRNLSAALALLGGMVSLDIYSATPPDILDVNNIRGFTHHGHVTDRKSTEVQRDADILFLPLAFHSTAQAVIRTSAPGKMGEYLASGRPILVHAPEDSFISWYCRTHECAEVVTDPDPAQLAAAIRRLGDQGHCDRLTAAAKRCAARDFAPEAARQKFLAAIGGKRVGE